MPYIETNQLTQSTILKIFSEKDEILVNPDYQRNGEVWSLEKQQLLIDSVLNEYDIPKLYFHKLSKDESEKKGKVFSIIDGRQRLEAIWKFIQNEFELADDFEYLKDPKVKAGGLTYADLAKTYPKLKIKFDSISLPIIVVNTDDPELIEDMFSRLNEAVPLNAAEKRNAFGGIVPKIITRVSQHKFFRDNVSFSNRRYEHKEAAAKVLFLVDCLTKKEGRIIDTKKVYLDDFVKSNRNKKESYFTKTLKETTKVLDAMSKIFTKKDSLLKAQGILPVYFLLIRDYLNDGKIGKFTRRLLSKFHDKLDENRKFAENNIAAAEFELLEFDRLSQQGTNDASSITTRLDILKRHIKI